MEEDEARPVALTPPALDRMGVAELERYIETLRAEIARAETHITSKRAGRSAADGLFKFG